MLFPFLLQLIMKGAMDTYPLHFPSNAEVKHAITALLDETRREMNTEYVTACNMPIGEVCTSQYTSACEGCYGVVMVLFDQSEYM